MAKACAPFAHRRAKFARAAVERANPLIAHDRYK
jgi:hypothetical protein